MSFFWLWLGATAGFALAGWARWSSWSERRRRMHIALAAYASLIVAMMSNIFMGDLIESSGPVLHSRLPLLILFTCILTAMVVLLVSAIPWRGPAVWLVLVPPPMLWLMSTSLGGWEVYSGTTGADLLITLAMMAWFAMVPWAVPAAWDNRGTWHGKAQVGVVALFVVYSLAPLAFEGAYALDGPRDARQEFIFDVEADGAYAFTVGHIFRGPWEGIGEHPERWATTIGSIDVVDAPGGFRIAGTGDGTVTFSLRFYGSVGDQEWHYAGDIPVRDVEGSPFLSVTQETWAPYCHFIHHWNGTLSADTSLGPGEGYGECS